MTRARNDPDYWFTKEIRREADVIIKTLLTLPHWNHARIATAMGYQSTGGYMKFLKSSGGCTKKKFYRLQELRDTLILGKKDPLPNKILVQGQTIVPKENTPTVLTFDSALDDLNTALSILLVCANAVHRLTPENFSQWADALKNDIINLLNKYGPDEHTEA